MGPSLRADARRRRSPRLSSPRALPPRRHAPSRRPRCARSPTRSRSWIDRLGSGLGRGPDRPGQPPPGRRHRLPHAARHRRRHLGPGHLPAHRSSTALNPPLVEGASVVVHAKPSFYANRGSLSLAAREIRMVGLGELLARLERRRQLLAAEGLFAPELKRDLPFLPRPGRPGHRARLAPPSATSLENARRRWPAVQFEIALRRHAGPALRRRGDRGAATGSSATPTST